MSIDVLYSFMDINPDTGAILLSDETADLTKTFEGDDNTEPGTNVYGCIKQVYKLKLANRSLKTLFSVGGFTYSEQGHFGFVTDAAKRATFVADAVTYIEDYGFDGM